MIARICKSLKRRCIIYLVNKVFVGTNPHFFEVKRKLLNIIGYKIGKGSKIVGPLYSTGKLVMGENCWIGAKFTIHGNGNVILGSNLDLGPEVTILTGSHNIGSMERRAGSGIHCSIKIEDGCWIGAKSVLLNSITIGTGSVVAAGAVVCKNIPPNTLVGGVPAKEIRKLDTSAVLM